jgi:hypothetical protein
MDNNTKAKIILEAAEQTAAELRTEGKAIMAAQTLDAFKGVPVGSLAKFYDIIQTFKTKKAALAAMGADA